MPSYSLRTISALTSLTSAGVINSGSPSPSGTLSGPSGCRSRRIWRTTASTRLLLRILNLLHNRIAGGAKLGQHGPRAILNPGDIRATQMRAIRSNAPRNPQHAVARNAKDLGHITAYVRLAH